MAEKENDSIDKRIHGGATMVRTHGHEFYEDISHRCPVHGGESADCQKPK